MNGFTLKTLTVSSIVLLSTLIPVLSLGINSTNKDPIYQAQLGCMSCHQAESYEAEKPHTKKPLHR